MGKYRVKETVAVPKGNKVTIHEPAEDVFINIDDDVAKKLGDSVERVGEPEPESKSEEKPEEKPKTRGASQS